jgi:hypothetical protein
MLSAGDPMHWAERLASRLGFSLADDPGGLGRREAPHRVLALLRAAVMFSTRLTGTSLYRCASSRRAPYSSVSTTTVIRDTPADSVWPTVSDSMLNARRRTSDATRFSTPGLLSTYTANV